MKEPQKLKPFDVLGAMTKNKLYTKEEVENCLDVNLLLKYLRGNRVTIFIAEYLNRNYQMEIYDMYIFAFYTIPPQLKYIKWVKTDKKVDDEDLLLLQKHYICNEDVAKVYLNLLDETSIKRIKRLYTKGRL